MARLFHVLEPGERQEGKLATWGYFRDKSKAIFGNTRRSVHTFNTSYGTPVSEWDYIPVCLGDRGIC